MHSTDCNAVVAPGETGSVMGSSAASAWNRSLRNADRSAVDARGRATTPGRRSESALMAPRRVWVSSQISIIALCAP